MKPQYKIVAIVDDDPDALDLWRREMDAARFQGEVKYFSAIDKAKSFIRESKPDLIITDLKLEGHFDASHISDFRIISADSSIVCYSSLYENQMIRQIYTAGANSFVFRENDINADIKMMRAITKYWLSYNISAI